MKFLYLSLVVIYSFSLAAQADTTLVEPNDSLHSPKRAALLSTLLPGAGQVYNHINSEKGKHKVFWKVPLIYAGLGATMFFAAENHIMQRNLKREYMLRVENNLTSTEYFPDFAIYDNQGILTLQQQHSRNRDLMLFAFVAVYGLNVLDAFVEAHFVEFDVSEDLTLSIQPSMQSLNTPGIRLALNFR
jgi:hypothetical protein